MGRPHSEETKKKIALANKGKKRTQAMNEAQSLARKGLVRGPLSEEVRQKISESLSGRMLSPEAVEKNRQGHLGLTHSTETKQRMSSSHRGKYLGQDTEGRVVDTDGYILLTGQYEHPLASEGGGLAEHRKVLYDKIGPGTHPCHWCDVELEWGGHEGINTDHVNWDKQDNRPENLVPSCRVCNGSRLKKYA